MASAIPRVLTFISLIFLGTILLLMNCSEEVAGPQNSPPAVDSIIVDPDAISPGGEVVLTALISDPDGDSVTYRWSTYPNAAKFSDTLAQICTLTVSTFLEGGMFLKVTLDVSDGKNSTSTDIWIPIVAGEDVSGHLYFANTLIPLPNTEVSIGRLADTTSFNGDYLIRHVPPGTRTIEVKRIGCDDYAAELNVTGSTTHDIFITCNELAKTVSGHVETFDGIVLESVEVRVLNKDGTETQLTDITDANGNFSIDLVPPGKRLFSIKDAGNPEYQVLSELFELVVDNDTTVNLRGRVKRTIFVSNGIDSPEDWLFEDYDIWTSWAIDSGSQCYSYNSCMMGGLGRLTMANSVAIPQDAGAVAWSVDVSLADAVIVIVYIIDGVIVESEDVAMGTGDFIVEKIAGTSIYDPAGRDFAVEFYVWGSETGVCGTACLRHFSLYYYQ